jgi:membrane-bound serine protease (ClpP class)
MLDGESGDRRRNGWGEAGMFFDVVIGLIAAIAIFELFEHVLLPLAALLREKSLRPVTGSEAMHGKRARVRQWRGGGGQVLVDGELWRAVSEVPLKEGDEVAVEAVEGLTLKVGPLRR